MNKINRAKRIPTDEAADGNCLEYLGIPSDFLDVK
jgi:hypothetical protein